MLAPPDEQQRIVEAIEEQFSRLDAGVESLQRAKHNLGRMRQSVVMSVFQSDWPEVELGMLPISREGLRRTSDLRQIRTRLKFPICELRMCNVAISIWRK